jgi:hypothetical protein
MFLIEIFLPVFDNAGTPFREGTFDRVRTELTERFGGVTVFIRSPAVGLWRDDSGSVQQDDIAIFEVMTDAVDAHWWRAYRRELERRFHQREIVIRAAEIERL